MRLGWDDGQRNAASLAAKAAASGVRMITVHGRTRCQFYKGRADWKAIREVVQAVDISVIANGDIIDVTSAKLALAQSGAAGVMVGRGSIGRPWVLADIAAGLRGKRPPRQIAKKDIIDLISDHYNAMLSFYGNHLGVRTARKHLSSYLAHFDVPQAFRHALLTQCDGTTVLRQIADLSQFEFRMQ